MIHVKDLSFTYKNGQKAVDCISFNIDKGEIFGFLGPSGAGKTTTQKLLIGLLGGYEGSISINGMERKNIGDKFYKNIGVAFEQPNLYVKLTGLENLNLMSSFYPQKCKNPHELLERIGLSDAANMRVEQFSKGMRMRLNFVRALQHNPDILFFDEPTSGLDPVNAQCIKDMIRELRDEGKTIFLTTHNMTVADQLCSRVAFIVNGKLEVIDAPDSLKTKYGSSDIIVKIKSNDKLSIRLEDIVGNAKLKELISSNQVTSIHSDDATLESVFIKVTGRELK